MRASELQDLIVATLTRQEGGSARRWRLAVGAVRVHDRGTHPDINWSIEPCGTPRENALIEELLDELRLSRSLIDRN